MADSLINENPPVHPMQLWAIILAAGKGTRLSEHLQGTAKQFIYHKDLPLYMHSALTISSYAMLKGIVFVFPEEYVSQEHPLIIAQSARLGVDIKVVSGGVRRQDSVQCGLRALPPQCSHVLVHDSARPFVSIALVHRLCEALQAGASGVIPTIPVVDTIKEIVSGLVKSTPPRESLFAVQTPQGFVRHILEQAHAKAEEEKSSVTDDASVLELLGHTVHTVPGEAENIKITHVDDLMKLQNTPSTRPCVGFGYDVHRFAILTKGEGEDAKNRPLKLGGVFMDGAMHVVAHSDGDVLLHALMDALLGATALGDIGLHFPDSSAVYDNADSAVLLQEVLRLVKQKGLEIHHIDLTIITQKPKISPQRNAIQKNVAHLLGLSQDRVNIKATTEEGLGFTGHGEGIKATAVVSGTIHSSTF